MTTPFHKDSLFLLSLQSFFPFRAGKGQGGLLFENALQRWDGTIFPVEANASFLQLADKEYLVAVARDITQRKAASDSKFF